MDVDLSTDDPMSVDSNLSISSAPTTDSGSSIHNVSFMDVDQRSQSSITLSPSSEADDERSTIVSEEADGRSETSEDSSKITTNREVRGLFSSGSSEAQSYSDTQSNRDKFRPINKSDSPSIGSDIDIAQTYGKNSLGY